MTGKNTPSIASEDRVSLPHKYAYGIGGVVDILSTIVFINLAYQMFNMELKIPLLYVGIIVIALRLWDGIIDPIMGWISDNTRSRWGRRRPYIFIGAILSGLTYPLIWWYPQGMSPEATTAWIIGFGMLFYTCFTIWNMPYQSLLMEMTPDYNERTRVTEIRGYFQAIASLAAGWCWWLSRRMVFADPDTGLASSSHGMRTISIIIGLIIIVLGLIPALFVKERYYESKLTRNQHKVGMWVSLKETFSNRPFLILCTFILLFMAGTQLYDKFGLYLGTYYVFGGDWDTSSTYSGYGTFLYMIISLSFIPYFRWLSERIGKPKCLAISLSLVMFAPLSTWITFRPDLPWLSLVSTAFVGIGYAGLWLMVPSIQVEVVDLDELKTGERREGNFASIFSWVLKFGVCFGVMLASPLLELTGFSADLAGPQPETVLQRMRIACIAYPIVTLLLALFTLRFFPITKEKALEIREQLEERRGKV